MGYFTRSIQNSACHRKNAPRKNVAKSKSPAQPEAKAQLPNGVGSTAAITQ